jgi:hypothetical protein
MKPIFLTIFYASLACSPKVLAFEILHQDRAEKFYFVFDGGTRDGVEEGMTACVYSFEGLEQYCGKTIRVNETRSGVYAPDQQEAWLEVGNFVRVKELGDTPRNQSANLSFSVSKKNALVPSRKSVWASNYVMTPLLPFKFNHPDFNIDARMSGDGSIWSSGVPVKQSLLGASVSRKAQLTSSFDHEASFTWRYLSPVNKDVDYDPNSGSVYAASSTKASNMSLSWNVITAPKNHGLSALALGGVSLDRLTFDFKSFVEGDPGTLQSSNLARSNATLFGAAVRLGGQLQLPFGSNAKTRLMPGILGAGATGVIPVYSKTTWTHGDHNLPDDAVQKDDSKSQLEDSVKLAKASFGVECNLFVGWMF